jgi:hemoglobin/transferrin/lactoferrin receptor protein
MMKKSNMKVQKLLLPLATALMAASAIAQEASPENPIELEEMVVVATKSPRPVSDVAGSVTVIDSERVDRELAQNIADLIRYEPGISVDGGGTRFGAGGYTIRGVGGNRVAIEIDGVPVSDQFDIGRFSNSGRDLVDVELLKRVEILRGPASTLYGSDAIGGVVSYITRNPEDLATARGQAYFGLKSGYNEADSSAMATATTAITAENLGALASLTYRQGHQLDNNAPAGTPTDNKEYDSRSAFAKLTWDTDQRNTLALTLDSYRRDDETNIQSVLGSGRFASTTLLTGDDRQDRDRIGLNYAFATDRSWLGGGQAQAWYQDSTTRQYSVEERAGSDLRRQRWFDYSQQSLGLELNLHKDALWGEWQHLLGYGFELIDTDSRESRNTLQTNLSGGNPSSIVLGEVFPVRDFPNTTTLEAGFYVQDEITRGESRWTLIPALRLDYYDLDPQPDALYLEDNPGSRIVGVSDRDISPKLGLLYEVSDHTTVFGQYAHGFRAPPFEDVNIGLDIPLFNIRAIPNPDLKSETSDGLELGVRWAQAGTSLALAGYYTNYRDFIETKVNLGPDPDSGVILFQSQNIDEAHIYGAELSLTQDLGYWSDALSDLSLSMGLAWNRGTNDENGQPLNSVDPAEAILGLSYSSPQWPLSASLITTLVDAHDRVADDRSETFETPGYGIVDLTASYQVNTNMAVRAGIFNLTDKRYWRWSEVRGLAADDPLINVLSAPGRNASFSFSIHW